MSFSRGGPRGSFGREILRGHFGREIAAAATPLLHPSRVDRDRTVLAEWRVVKMVVALVWKVASSRAWNDCCRRGVIGVSVEMLFVAMIVVALCTKITIVKEKRLSEDHSPYKSHIFPLYNGMG